MLGEDSGESCNKRYKSFRPHHCRKDSRIHTMTDLLYRCIDASDPLLSSCRQSSNRHSRRLQALLPEVQALLEAENGDRDTSPVDQDDPDADLGSFEEFEVAEIDVMLDVEEEIEVETEAQVNVRNMICASRCNI